jgi:hypothetical protein
MDLNPVAVAPSASIPHIPYTDLNEILKIYGEAEVTVSDTRAKEEPDTEGNASDGAF